MFFKIDGLPDENEIVLCKVTKIFPNSVFVKIIEYNQSGMIHISEISPGRIRNIRDYVSIDRQIICKVLRLDKESGHIDLSLRRVNSMQRREKLEEIKHELKAEQLVKNLAKKLDLKTEDLYKKITKKVFEEYSHLYLFFKDIVAGNVDAKTFIDQSIVAKVEKAVRDKFKEPKIIFQGEINLSTFHEDGLDRVKKTLHSVEKISNNLAITYLGGGRYKFLFEEKDIKKAETELTKVEAILEKFNDKLSTSSFSRKRAEVEE